MASALPCRPARSWSCSAPPAAARPRRCAAGLEHPTSGEISIAGKVVSSPERGILVPPRLRELGMVFQSYAVWPHMTVRQNVVYPLKHRKLSRSDARLKVDEALELVGLSEYAERPVV